MKRTKRKKDKEERIKKGERKGKGESGVAQWKRDGLITRRSVDRNHSSLSFFLIF